MSTFVTLGEIMGRLCTPGHARFQQSMPGSLEVTFGGAEASVAGIIVQLGGDAAFVTALPDNPLGDACLANLRSLSIAVDHVLRTGDGRLGLYFVEQGIGHRPGQVVYDRADSSFATAPPESYDWDSIFRDADWLLSTGITPAISANAAEVARTAFAEADRRGIRIACDMNFRSKLWRWKKETAPQDLAAETMQELVQQVDLLICGRGDAVQTLAIDANISDQELPQAVASRFPRLQTIAITRRQSVSAKEQTFSASLYDVASGKRFDSPTDGTAFPIGDIADRIGTGDAFAGALLFALHSNRWSEPGVAISFATAACCLAHTIEGDFSLMTCDEIQAFLEGEGSGRIRR
jgi:2-dehydro-3-deoxygluconokinase